ncbi:M-phase phosphoprotein 8-like, partial [Limulus polyphemus]|uniref:M-phase phosphoprotein 8-like n=1 Tax=Limulus polyphemus TaxID=6850 RepID=A0ABM1BTX1_LIMPO
MEHIGLQQIFEDENVFEVEAIVGRKKVNGKWLYRVRWKGYSAHHDTWEPRENLLTCEDMIEDYAEKIQKKASKRKAKVTSAKRKVEKKENYDKIETNDSEPQPSEMKSGHGLKDSFWKDLEEGKINVFESDLYSRVKARPKPVKSFIESGLSQGSAKKKNTDTSKKRSFDQDRVKSKRFELQDNEKLSKQSDGYDEYKCNSGSATQEQDGDFAHKIILSKKSCQTTKNSMNTEGVYQAKEGSTKISLKQGLSGYYEVSKITNSYEQSLPFTRESKLVSTQVQDQLNANDAQPVTKESLNASCSVPSVTTSTENKVKKNLDNVQDNGSITPVSAPSRSPLQKNVKTCDNESMESNKKNKIQGEASHNLHSPSQKSILSHVSVSQPSAGTKPTPLNGVDRNHGTTDVTVKDASSVMLKLEDPENKKIISRALQKATLVQSSHLSGKSDGTDVKEKAQFLIHLDDYSADDWARKKSLMICPPLDISQNELREAVKAGDYNTVKRALNGSRQYDLELPEVNGMTLVMTAAARGYTSITEVLATSGANINAQSKNGLTPLMFACIK